MVKIYSRLDRLLNVSICVHFPSKNFFFFFFLHVDSQANLLVWGVQRLVIYMCQIVVDCLEFLKTDELEGRGYF